MSRHRIPEIEFLRGQLKTLLHETAQQVKKSNWANNTEVTGQLIDRQRQCNDSIAALQAIENLLSESAAPIRVSKGQAENRSRPTSPAPVEHSAFGISPSQVNEIASERAYRADAADNVARNVLNESYVPSHHLNKKMHIRRSDVRATGYFLGRDKEFLVEKGSQMRLQDTGTFSNKSKRLRAELIRNGMVVRIGSHYVFQANYTFSSPSSASNIILGTSSNGYADWVTESGEPLGTLYPKKKN